jgi:hypothetical protein
MQFESNFLMGEIVQPVKLNPIAFAHDPYNVCGLLSAKNKTI